MLNASFQENAFCHNTFCKMHSIRMHYGIDHSKKYN